MNPQAGWYKDPLNAHQLRWWDGSYWTDHTAPHPQLSSKSAPPPKRTLQISWPKLGLRVATLMTAIIALVFAVTNSSSLPLVASLMAKPSPRQVAQQFYQKTVAFDPEVCSMLSEEALLAMQQSSGKECQQSIREYAQYGKKFASDNGLDKSQATILLRRASSNKVVAKIIPQTQQRHINRWAKATIIMRQTEGRWLITKIVK